VKRARKSKNPQKKQKNLAPPHQPLKNPRGTLKGGERETKLADDKSTRVSLGEEKRRASMSKWKVLQKWSEALPLCIY